MAGRNVQKVNPGILRMKQPQQLRPLTLPLKWHGGKGGHNGKLARWIVSLMPEHTHYVEPFAGGLAVLLHRDPDDSRLWVSPDKGVSEVVNDIDQDLTTFWRVLRRPATFEAFRRQVETIAFSQAEWEEAG